MTERNERDVVQDASPMPIPISHLEKPMIERCQDANTKINLDVWAVPPEYVVLHEEGQPMKASQQAKTLEKEISIEMWRNYVMGKADRHCQVRIYFADVHEDQESENEVAAQCVVTIKEECIDPHEESSRCVDEPTATPLLPDVCCPVALRAVTSERQQSSRRVAGDAGAQFLAYLLVPQEVDGAVPTIFPERQEWVLFENLSKCLPPPYANDSMHKPN